MVSMLLKSTPKKIIDFITYYRLPILSGILIGTSYIPFPPWALLFCLTPLWLFCINEKSLRRSLVGSWLAQFTLTIIGFNWVAHTIHEFGHLPWIIAILGLFIFASFASLFVPLGVLIWRLLLKRVVITDNLSSFFSLLTLAISTAIANRFMPTIFPWNPGYPWLWADLPIYNLAELIGFQGLATLTFLFSAAFTWAWLQKDRKRILIVIVISQFVVLNGVGAFVGYFQTKPDALARVMIVQANIGNLAKVYAEKGWGYRTAIVKKYLRFTKKGLDSNQAAKGVDFALWPETAFADDLGPNYDRNANAARLKTFLKENQLKLATGAYSEEPKSGKTTNSMFFLDEQGQYTDTHYYKTLLLAFGEYLPGSETFPFLSKWLPRVANFARGPGPSVKTMGEFKLGPQICYESLYPQVSVDIARLGAQIFLNATNDSWYGTWQEPYQHLYMTLARAIEVRRPLVRATNTGISTVITSYGKVMETSPLHTEWFHIYKVPYNKNGQNTFFVNFPWLMTALEFAFLLLFALSGRLWRK